MAWSAPSTRTTGELITATIWNQDVSANPIALRAGAIAMTSQAANDLVYCSSATQFARIAAAASSVLVTSAGSVPSLSTTLPSGLAATNLTLTTPVLGTPQSGALTNCTSIPAAQLSGTITSATQDLITRTGTIASGVWNAGAVTSSGVMTANGSGGGDANFVATNADNTQFGFKLIRTGTNATTTYLYTPAASTDFRIYHGGADRLTISSAGILTVSARGAHTFGSTGTESALLRVINTTGDLYLGVTNSAGNDPFTLGAYSSYVVGRGAAGLDLMADHASGDVRIRSCGALAVTFGKSAASPFYGKNGMWFGDTADAGRHWYFSAEASTSEILASMGNGITTSSTMFNFTNSNGAVGSITTNGSATAFNTSSDARLKHDHGIATTTDVLRSLLVHDFDWIAGRTRDRGLFAQEAYRVKPLAVTVGRDDVGPDGILAAPWHIDYSKFVPDLIVGWQNHEARILSLEHELATLKAQRIH